VDGVLVLRAVAAEPLARYLHDPRSHYPRTKTGPALRLSRLLDRGLQEDRLQGPLPAAAAAGAVRLAAGGCIGRNAVRAAGLSGDRPDQVHAPSNCARDTAPRQFCIGIRGRISSTCSIVS